MTTPHVRFDSRFSEPSASAVPWEQTLAAIEAAQLFWVTTVRADGRPHMTPLVSVWTDAALHFSTGPAEQKALNLRANQNVLLSTGCNDWNRGLDVVVEGAAERVVDNTLLGRLAQLWRAKWDGESWDYNVVDGGFQHDGGDGLVLVFAVRPAKVMAFGKAPFSQTTYAF